MPFMIDSFFELGSERAGGFDIMPIPWSRIRAFGEAMQFDAATLSDFHVIVRSMDDHFITKKRAKDGKSKPVQPTNEGIGPKG